MPIGHGKVILLGEHAVVYGRPALAAAVGIGAQAHAEPGATDRLLVEPWGMDVSASGDDGELGAAFQALLATYPPNRPHLLVRARVDLPSGAGLGCSAALGVAIIRAVDECLHHSRSLAAVAEASLAWERVFHGQPSGIDSALASAGGVAFFRKNTGLEPIRLSRPFSLVVAHSGTRSSTKDMVSQLAQQRERTPERIDTVFDAIASLTTNGRLALEAGDLKGFGQLMDLNQALLASLLLSTDRIEAMCTRARDAGALGAKLTGAGGGGCVIALSPDAHVSQAIADALQALGRELFIAEIST